MTFLEKLQQPNFFKNTLRIATVFFLVLVLISILFNSFQAAISFDVDAVAAANFSEGKWKAFFVSKVFASVIYGVYVTAKNTK